MNLLSNNNTSNTKKIALIGYIENPFLSLVKKQLDEIGYDAFCYKEINDLPKEEKFDIINFNWVNEIYFTGKKSSKDILVFLKTFISLKFKKNKLSYTLHNLYPHDISFKLLYYIFNMFIFKLVDEIIVMSVYQKMILQEKYLISNKKIRVFYHGNYINSYKNNISREEARKKIGLKEKDFVYLFLGKIKPYKNIPYLIEEFNKIKKEDDMLLIAGKNHQSLLQEEISKLKNKSVKTYFDRIDEDEVQTFMNASDVCVLPFKAITTSGSLLLAMSFGKPVICPDYGGLSEYVKEDFGILYTENRLSRALRDIKKRDLNKMGKMAFQKAIKFDWQEWRL